GVADALAGQIGRPLDASFGQRHDRVEWVLDERSNRLDRDFLAARDQDIGLVGDGELIFAGADRPQAIGRVAGDVAVDFEVLFRELAALLGQVETGAGRPRVPV